MGGNAPGRHCRRYAGITVTLCLLAWFALLPAHDGAAQDRSPSPSPEGLWKNYPLAPTAEPAPSQASVPAASDRRAGYRGARGQRRRRAGGRPCAARARRGRRDADGHGDPSSPRARARAGCRVRAAAVRAARGRAAGPGPVASPVWALQQDRHQDGHARDRDGRGDAGPDGEGGGTGDDPRRRDGPAGPAGQALAGPPVAAPARAGAPPDPRRSWAAEIEWRQIDGESRFCAIARGAATVEVAQSPPLDWPPEGPAAVQAVTDAADELAATLVAAGWKPLAPGSAWYAKRFAWEPGARPRTSPGKPTGAKRGHGAAPGGARPGLTRQRRPRPRQTRAREAARTARRARPRHRGGAGRRAAVRRWRRRRGAARQTRAPTCQSRCSRLVGVLLLVLAIRHFRSVLRRTAPRGDTATRSPR